MTRKKELQKLLDLLDGWDHDTPFYQCSSQSLLDLLYNRKNPFQYIKLGQPEDKFIGISESGNEMYLGSSPLEHYIEIGDHRIYGRQPVGELTNLVKALLEQEN